MVNNKPLTWDELLLMKGKPIWIEWNNGTKYWTVIRSIGKISDGSYMFTDDLNFYSDDGKGKKWETYRQEQINETKA